MRALKLKDTGEWVKFIDVTGELGTCECPDLLPDTATLEGLRQLYEEHHRTLDISRLIMFEVEINVIKEVS